MYARVSGSFFLSVFSVGEVGVTTFGSSLDLGVLGGSEGKGGGELTGAFLSPSDVFVHRNSSWRVGLRSRFLPSLYIEIDWQSGRAPARDYFIAVISQNTAMNVLGEVLYGVKEESYYETASHLCGNSGSRSARFGVAPRWNEQCAGSHYDCSLVSLQGFLVNSRHFWIAWNDVTRSIISGYFDQYASMLRHRESNHRLILHYINLRLANVEIGRRLRCARSKWNGLDDATRARPATRLSSRYSRRLLCIHHWGNTYEQ
jgi:hypothetical protein